MRLIRRFVLVLLLAAAVAARSASAQRAPGSESDQRIVLLSLDGFRWDYLDRPEAVSLRALAGRGVRAERMIPSFPTKTFPNHYTIVTGLYPEHHGIVANTMWDSTIGRRFTMSDTSTVRDARWWGGEPIWVTAIRQGRKSAAMFWPGSEAPIGGILPTYYRRYDGAVPNVDRVRQVLAWLTLPKDRAPVIVTLYMSDVDGAGHQFGPDAPQTSAAIARVDQAVGVLARGLDSLGLAGSVNVIVVADHGMTAVSRDRSIYLDDYIELSTIDVVDWTPVGAIIPKPGHEAEVYERLRGKNPHLAVYRKRDVPARFHFNAHPRITPLVLIADEGWSITSHARQPVDGGAHGYDNALPSMGALFAAAGPAFKRGLVVPPFSNVHLYDLMAA
ncbi:MAG: ectonucleotide pyrophosphatase/phosphodiesterase, partial [Gemmatimonadota bacterium]